MNHRHLSSRRRSSPQGFTRIELVTVLAAVAVLAALQFPLHGNTRGTSRLAQCLTGLRQLQLGWSLYAADNAERLVSGYESANDPQVGPDWSARTWIDFNGSNTANYDPSVFPARSPLFPYAGDRPSVYRCPSDPARVQARTESGEVHPMPRTRSRSINGWVGGPGWMLNAQWRYATSLTQLVDPGPAETFTFIDEREESINDGGLLIDMTGFPLLPGHAVNSSPLRMVDFPAYWHANGAGVAFADGHVDPQRWKDARTVPSPRPGNSLALNVASPNNVDVFWLQSHSPRVSR